MTQREQPNWQATPPAPPRPADPSAARSRRAILAGAVGGLAAMAVQALGRAAPVAAVNGEAIVTGGSYGADSATRLSVPGTASVPGGQVALIGETTATDTSKVENYGVWGVSRSSGIGILGSSDALGTGVIGLSGNPIAVGDLLSAKAKTGVYGSASQDAGSRGVWGYALAGRGVFGQATTGLGVRGFATYGIGLSGEASTRSGYALRTKGRVRLDQSAGQATITSGHNNVTVTPGIDLTTMSAVVATLNGDAGGSTTVQRVAIDTTADTFTIYLTANTTASVRVAWIVLS